MIAEVYAELAAKVWTRCPCHHLKVWPFRKSCPDEGEDVGLNASGVHTQFGYRPFQDMPHEACSGLGYVPDVTLEKMLDVALAWDLQILVRRSEIRIEGPSDSMQPGWAELHAFYGMLANAQDLRRGLASALLVARQVRSGREYEP